MPDLYQELISLAESDMYPFHMPGHKRNCLSTPLEGAFRCDITEIDGFDNLHDEDGIILQAEERANSLYGADKTYFLVNGSTSGVLSAVSSAVHKGGTVLAARASHKSFYHAAYLRDLDIHYLPDNTEKELNIPGRYSAKDVEKCLTDDVEAVFITSPTYEGKCSDIRGIAEACHRRGIALIVDEAHGAHFGFGKEYTDAEGGFYALPNSAVSEGADLVIHSTHKTLPSMTQTALIHVQGNIVDKGLLKRFLRIYQSSSPSYVLMSSIDLCMKEMEEKGDEFVRNLLKYRNKIQEETASNQLVKVLGHDDNEDAAKVVISVKDTSMTGQQLYDILREEYALQLEMAGEKFALAIISGWDTEEGIDRLIRAINDLEKKAVKEEASSKYGKLVMPSKAMKLSKAWDSEKEVIKIDEAAGHIAGEFINLYPPGTPIIAPGEVFSKEILDTIKTYLGEGLNVQGIVEDNKGNKEGIICVRQK